MASSESEAAILLDEFSSLRDYAPACVTGKAAPQGGAAHVAKAHPRAAALVLREVASRFEREVSDLRVAIYATTSTAADYLAEFASIGCPIVALSDGRSTAHDERGLNPLAIVESVRHNGTVSAFPGTAESAIAADCDVLVLASTECSLNAMNAGRVRASVVLEAAPLSVTPSADVLLRQQRATVIPDLLASSGSIIAAHAEWTANIEQKQLHARDIETEFERRLPQAAEAVVERSKKDHSSLRSAAYCIAVERVARTERLRGI
jgi:glutamate dehydrogenase/leucine dehydrogenase